MGTEDGIRGRGHGQNEVSPTVQIYHVRNSDVAVSADDGIRGRGHGQHEGEGHSYRRGQHKVKGVEPEQQCL